MTVVCIHQPDFIPWTGFFDRLAKSDVFVILDNVQFINRGWHHRDKIKTAAGFMWLTVPVKKKGRYKQPINEVEIDYSRKWVPDHLGSLGTWYGRAPYFRTYFPLIRGIYERNYSLLIDLNMAFLELLMRSFQIEATTLLASALGVVGKSTDMLVELVGAVGGDTYLSGVGARAYLDEARFSEAGITVKWQDYNHPVYPQLHGEFIPCLSSIDFLFNCGSQCGVLLKQ